MVSSRRSRRRSRRTSRRAARRSRRTTRRTARTSRRTTRRAARTTRRTTRRAARTTRRTSRRGARAARRTARQAGPTPTPSGPVPSPTTRQPTQGTVSPVQKQTGLEGARQRLVERRQRLSTQAARRGRREGVGARAKRFGQRFGIGLGLSAVGTAQFGKALFTRPIETIKETGRGIKRLPQTLKKAGPVLKQEPGLAFGFVTGEVLGGKALGSVARAGAKGATIVGTRVSPRFKKATPAGIKEITVSGKQRPLPFAGPISRIGEPVSKQVSRKTVQPVVAARDLFTPFQRRKVIEKPKPEPGAPPLERALFADPAGRLRISRLGLEPQKRAGLSDILAGDVTFRRARPQAIVFAEQKLGAFPPGLRKVKKKLKAGKTLTPRESRKLEKFQLTPTGEFKGPGFISKEPEIVLAPGEVIRRKRVAGVTLIKGRRVEIIEAGIEKAPKRLAPLTQKEISGVKLTASESRTLQRATGISRPPPRGAKRVSPTELSSRVVRGVGRAPSIKVTPPRRRPARRRKKRDAPYRAPRVSPYRTSVSPTVRASPSPRIVPRAARRAARRGRVIPKTLLIKEPLLKSPKFKAPKVKAKKKRKKKKKQKVREVDIFARGFTARAVGIKSKGKRVLTQAERGIGIRA